MRIFGLLLMLLFVLLTANTGRICCRWLKAVGICPLFFGIFYGVAVSAILVLFVLSRIPECPVPRVLLRGSHYGLGVFVYTLLFVNLFAIFFGKSQKTALIALISCSVLIIGFSVYGIRNAGNVQVVHYPIAVRRETTPIKIALVSDLHLGYIMDANRLQKVVDTINAIEPDLVCIAGDLFDGDITALSDPDAIQTVFRSIPAPIYACLGNHDAGAGYSEMLTFLEEAGIHVLLDEAVTVDDRLLLAGRRDSSPIGAHEGTRTAVPLPQDNTLPVVVLDHQPGNIGEYGDDVDLILCGHTHRGQLFPGNLVTKQLYAVDYGYYRASETAPQVIVTSGAGTWGPVLRVGSDCEVAEITIQKAEK